MLKLLVILTIHLSVFANANTCMNDIYFGNGVWNTYKQANVSKKALKKFIQQNNPTRFSSTDEDKTYSFKLAYNNTYGTSIDLIETHWQLYESGQISEGYFSFVAHVLDGRDTEEEFLKDLREIIAQSDADTSNMYVKYQAESFNLKHNVLLVSHSQGNLFANKIYAQLSSSEKQHFQNVAIATPASRVFSGGPYVTLNQDAVVGAIPGSLPGNAEGFGHTFVPSYLNNPNSATKEKIAVGINEAVDVLDAIGCGKYFAFQFVSYVCSVHTDPQELVVDIYGATYKNGETLYTNEIVMTEHQRRILKEIDEYGNLVCPLKRFDIVTTNPEFNKGCDAYIIHDVIGKVEPGSYENSFTCAQYSLKSETVEVLNMLLSQ